MHFSKALRASEKRASIEKASRAFFPPIAKRFGDGRGFAPLSSVQRGVA
jgi:hypothetical protein